MKLYLHITEGGEYQIYFSNHHTPDIRLIKIFDVDILPECVEYIEVIRKLSKLMLLDNSVMLEIVLSKVFELGTGFVKGEEYGQE